MSKLIVIPGFPVTNAGGTEGLGVGVDTATGLSVCPDGTTGTPAQIRTLVEAALAAGQLMRLFQLWRQPNPF